MDTGDGRTFKSPQVGAQSFGFGTGWQDFIQDVVGCGEDGEVTEESDSRGADLHTTGLRLDGIDRASQMDDAITLGDVVRPRGIEFGEWYGGHAHTSSFGGLQK